MAMDEVLSNVFDAAIAELDQSAKIGSYYNDPVGFARDVLGIHLWSKQREMVQSIADNPRTAVRSAHGTGKSLTSSIIVCWWVATRPDAVAVTTAPTFAQISTILWAEIAKHHQNAQARYDAGLSPMKLPGKVLNSNVWKDDNGKILAFGRKPADSNEHGFQGIHRRYVLAIIDEACGIKESLYTAIEAIATTEGSRILAVGNPDDPNTHFGKIFMDAKMSSQWNHIHISAFHSPNLTRGQGLDDDIPDELRPYLIQQDWVDDHREMWGLDSPRYASKVLGDFPKQSASSLFSQGVIDKAVATVVKPDRDSRPVLGVDVARFGPDYSTIYRAELGTVWQVDQDGNELGPLTYKDGKGKEQQVKGKSVRFLEAKSKADAVETANWIHQIALREGAAEVRIDTAGIGGPVRDQVAVKAQTSYNVVSMNGSGPTPDRYRWRNARAWWHDELRQQMQDGKLDMDYADTKLKDELLGIEYHFKNNWRALQVESKEDMANRGLKSPDYSDAVVYATAPIEQITANPLAQFEVGAHLSVDAAQFLGLDGKFAILGPF